jgi:multidrug transporter EmrE-like cation transporter
VPSASDLLRLGRQPLFVAGFLLSALAAVLWFRILATQNLSTCYPLFVGLTYFLITVGAFYFLGESISAQKIVGLAVIVLGVAAVAQG